MRSLVTAGCIVLIYSTVIAAPVDTVFDALHYVEFCKGDELLDLLSDSFRQQIDLFYNHVLELAETDPNTASQYLSGSGISISDLEWMDQGDIASRILEHLSLPTFADVISDSTVFNGNYAETILTMADSSKIYVYLVFEDSEWKLNGSSIVTDGRF